MADGMGPYLEAERKRGLPAGIADYTYDGREQERWPDAPDVTDIADIADLPDIYLDPQELRRTFLAHSLALARGINKAGLKRQPTSYHFGSPQPTEAVDFEVLDTPNNKKLGLYPSLAVGTYRALITTPSAQDLQALQQAWQNVSTPEDRAQAFAVSRQIVAPIKDNPQLANQRRQWASEVALPLGIAPPVPETDFKIFLVGLKQPSSGYVLSSPQK